MLVNCIGAIKPGFEENMKRFLEAFVVNEEQVQQVKFRVGPKALNNY